MCKNSKIYKFNILIVYVEEKMKYFYVNFNTIQRIY